MQGTLASLLPLAIPQPSTAQEWLAYLAQSSAGRPEAPQPPTKRYGDLPVDAGNFGVPLGENGVSGNFWGSIKGAKYHFALQDGTWDYS